MSRRSLCRCGLFVLLFVLLVDGDGSGSPLWAAPPPRNLAVTADITDVRTLPQNWSDEESRWYYNAAQGSKLIPYAWYLHLEQPDSQEPFRSAEHFRSLGYLPRTPDDLGNPDGLPIGFTKDGEHLGMTCAACHTAQIDFRGMAWLIDGAPTLGDMERMQRRLIAALEQTFQGSAKFDRFAQGVLGNGAGAPAKAALKSRLQEVLAFRRGAVERDLPKPGAAPFGPGRVDAIGAILNEIVETFAQVPNNHAPADAPVSYPAVWDAPQHDRVQWNGAVENKVVPLLQPLIGTPHVGALGRNSGEVLGVFGTVDATREGSLLELRSYPSSINKDHLIKIEESLRRLWSPVWPAELPPIDEPLRAAGETLFQEHCRDCHANIRRDAPDRQVIAEMRAVGTDQSMAANFATRTAKTGVLEGRKATLSGFRKLQAVEPARVLLVHMSQKVLLRPSPLADRFDFTPNELLGRLQSLDLDYPVYGEVKVGDRKLLGAFQSLKVVDGKVHEALSRHALKIAEAAKIFRQDSGAPDDDDQFEAADGTILKLNQLRGVKRQALRGGTQLKFEQPAEIEYAYKGRPLNGIWATAPFLHNGSVPNLDELLKPAGKRLKTFRLGSREFDPDRVGFRLDQGDFLFDTALKGNSNAGHDYGREFTDTERRQLIEYMKSL
ncbi:MAG: di-heme-cytochrome C peroxidase [Planctomycetales bacterium]